MAGNPRKHHRKTAPSATQAGAALMPFMLASSLLGKGQSGASLRTAFSNAMRKANKVGSIYKNAKNLSKTGTDFVNQALQLKKQAGLGATKPHRRKTKKGSGLRLAGT